MQDEYTKETTKKWTTWDIIGAVVLAMFPLVWFLCMLIVSDNHPEAGDDK
jgi:hypothetical protein